MAMELNIYKVKMNGFAEGNFENGLIDGKGKIILNNITMFDGAFRKGIRDGFSTQKDEKANLLYQGYFKNNNYEGEGTLYNIKDNFIYKGFFKNGIMEGKGKLFLKSNYSLIYDGEWKNGLTSDKNINMKLKKDDDDFSLFWFFGLGIGAFSLLSYLFN